MRIRAKFRVDSKEFFPGSKSDANPTGEIVTVRLSPVYSSDPGHENRLFWDATPTGKIEIGCANRPAADAFELGEEYYVDFVHAPKAED